MQPQIKRQPAKPVLDEQAFQQLLSAAYVMQEHNARLKKVGASPKTPAFDAFPVAQPQKSPLPVPPPADTLSADPERAAGSTMQKNWASLWEMHHTNKPPERSKEAAELQGAKAVEVTEQNEAEVLFPAELEEIVSKFGEDEAAPEQAPANQPPGVENAPHRILEETALVTTRPTAVVRADQAPVEGTPSSPWASARKARAWLESVRAEKAGGDWLRQQWQESRGNLYVIAAALVLLVVIVQWLATPPPKTDGGPRQLSTFEQLLVSIGVAEPPPPPHEYHGNPNTKVWVDVRTGLYYCPGAELYGKSKDGKITIQLDAQRDQFQPSTLKPCD